MQLIFATNNPNKVKEIKKVIPKGIDILSLEDAGIHVEIPEPYFTLKENASAKSQTIFKLTNKNCFSEDTGLHIKALNGAPGVHSARYAGEPASDRKNIAKLLQEMSGKTDRQAYFKTVISLIWENKEYWFEGICEGTIIQEKKGEQGFGYDPVFIPDGSRKTFAEMAIEEKNRFSHRKKAVQKLVSFLQDSLEKKDN